MTVINQTDGFDDPKSALLAVDWFRTAHSNDDHATVSVTTVTVVATKGANKGNSYQRYIVHSKWRHINEYDLRT